MFTDQSTPFKTVIFDAIESAPIVDALTEFGAQIEPIQIETIKHEVKRHTWIWTTKSKNQEKILKYFIKSIHAQRHHYFYRLYAWRKLVRHAQWQIVLHNHHFNLPRPLVLIKMTKRPKDMWQVDTYHEDYVNLKIVSIEQPIGANKLMQILLRFATQIARLHGSGFVHGDLKWSNLMWHAADDQILIVDWDNIKHSHSFRQHGSDIARFLIAALEAKLEIESIEEIKKHYLTQRQLSTHRIRKMEIYITRRITKLRQRKKL